MNSDNNSAPDKSRGPATMPDTGFRRQQGQATMPDTGFRRQQGQATMPDTGFRRQQGQATMPDTGFRRQQGQATMPDTGFRSQGQATQADTGWRGSEPETIDTFRARVSSLTELTSYSKRVYKIERTLSDKGGEAAVMLCTDQSGRYAVAKIFYGVSINEAAMEARKAVLKYMQSPAGREYTLAVVDVGFAEIGGSTFYFEITPYCESGDLTGEGAFTFRQIEELVPRLNEALHSMHKAGILHRDIKPDNLYRLNGKIVIGDFGIARLANAGATGTAPGTAGYRAPESVLVVAGEETKYFFDEKCDYYSLGVTLASLYEGHFVYENMNPAAMMLAVTKSRIPMSKSDENRPLLENLISGLCQFDATRRFGYEEVKSWVEDHGYSASAGGSAAAVSDTEKFIRPFTVSASEQYWYPGDLFAGLTKDAAHWETAKKFLFNKTFENFFSSFRPDLSLAAQTVEEEWRKDSKSVSQDKSLSIFLKELYPSGPIVWRGYTFSDFRGMADRMKATKTPDAYGEILRERVISHWLENTPDIDPKGETRRLVAEIEKLSDREPGVACYWFGNYFSGSPQLTVCGMTVSDIAGLCDVIFASPENFYDGGGLEALGDRDRGAALYGFLYSFGYRELIDEVYERASEMTDFSRACLLVTMMEMIAENEGAAASAEKIKSFYVTYGPAAYASYVKKLVMRQNGQVYKGLDRDGEHALADIRDYRLVETGDMSDISKSFSGLITLVDRMRGMLTDNPQLISSGIYESHGVICLNLVGCFAFSMLGKPAPLGFSAQLGI